MDTLDGKVAVVTGAASGIGLALTKRFAAEGMQVMLADVDDESLEGAAKSIADEHGKDKVAACRTDVREADELDALADATFARFGTAHVLCNNAGVAVGGLTWTIPADRWRWIVDVNLHGVVNGIRSFVPRMIEQNEGHVVNTASIAGFITAPAMSPYLATKHAVVALTESLYFDLQVAGAAVGTSVLCPAWVRTQIHESDRIRPDGVTPLAEDDEADPGAANARQLMNAFVNSGIDPAIVADKVLDAVTTERFWVFTHDNTLAMIEPRWQAVRDDAKPALWAG